MYVNVFYCLLNYINWVVFFIGYWIIYVFIIMFKNMFLLFYFEKNIYIFVVKLCRKK